MFLSPGTPSTDVRIALSQVEDDFRGTRKIARSTVTTSEDLQRALYPLISLVNRVKLERTGGPNLRERLTSLRPTEVELPRKGKARDVVACSATRRHVKIKHLTVAGFRGIRGKVDIEFPPGFVVITGENGTGKSTICDAIEYALSGTVLRHPESKETGETFEDYLWWRGPGKVESRFVTLTLVTDGNQEVTIKRGPRGLEGIDEETIGGALSGEPSSGSSVAHDLCQTTIIRGEHVAELSLDLAETDRFNFVKQSLGATDLSHVEMTASEVSKSFKDEASKLESEYARVRSLILQITGDISAATAQLSETVDLSAAESELRSLLGNEVDSTTLMPRGRSELASLRNRIPALIATSQQIEALKTSIRESETAAYEGQVKQVDEQLATARRRQNALEKDDLEIGEQLQRERRNQPALESLAQLCEHGRRLGLQDGRCPLCASTVSRRSFQ